MKYEWKKQDKSLYGAKITPGLINIPAQNYIMDETEKEIRMILIFLIGYRHYIH